MPKRFHFQPFSFLLVAVLLSSLYILTGATAKKPAASKPNVIIFFIDDLGYGDLSVNGALGYTTPHLDRLAREGTRFTNFLAAQAVCTASRAALLTGCYPNRLGLSGALGPT